MKSNVGNKGDSVKTKKTMKRWDKGGSGKKENKWEHRWFWCTWKNGAGAHLGKRSYGVIQNQIANEISCKSHSPEIFSFVFLF